jgi:hypothetical protein
MRGSSAVDTLRVLREKMSLQINERISMTALNQYEMVVPRA